MKLLLEITFIGTAYCGFQVQPNAVSVQSRLQDAVEAVYGERYPVTGCSRTDSGVHARRFFCTVEGERCGLIPVENLPEAMNIKLPYDIAVRMASVVPDSFHPRYNATGKEYRYFILNSRIRDPFYEGRTARFPKRLDENIMNTAAECFKGRHDFAGFMAKGSSVTDTVREIKRCNVTRDGDMLTLTVAADGFLYNMVRIIAGTLIDVSRGKIDLCSVPDVINSLDRGRAGFTAPPEGLYLWDVFY